MDPLVHLAIIWAAVFAAVVAAKKTRLTPVLYFLFIGCVLANSGILPTESGLFIRSFADLGIIFIMFSLGFEESTDNFLSSAKRSWGIALFGALGPFVVAYLIADYIWQDNNIALVVGLAMTATAVSLTMVSLKELGLSNSRVATRIMTSALLDDIGALIMVAILVPVATGTGELTMLGLAVTASKAVVFFLIVTLIGAWIFPQGPLEFLRNLPVLRSVRMRYYLTFDEGRYATLAILLAALVVGLLAHYFGFHEAVGAYMAGLIVREEHFLPKGRASYDDQALEHEHIYAKTKHIVDDAAFCWIGPVFFVDLGAKILFDWNLLVEVLPYAVTMVLGIATTQIVSAGLAAKYTSGMSAAESLMIGFGMLGRAELAFVVMDIAYVQNDILPVQAFFTLMITAFFLNILVPVSISWWRPHYLRAIGQSPNRDVS